MTYKDHIAFMATSQPGEATSIGIYQRRRLMGNEPDYGVSLPAGSVVPHLPHEYVEWLRNVDSILPSRIPLGNNHRVEVVPYRFGQSVGLSENVPMLRELHRDMRARNIELDDIFWHFPTRWHAQPYEFSTPGGKAWGLQLQRVDLFLPRACKAEIPFPHWTRYHRIPQEIKS